MQDVSARISASGSCRTSCARSLYEDLLSRISLSCCLHQDPVGPLAQDLCLRISCARSLCHDVCIRILWDLLCKISVCGSLVQVLSVMMSASGSCRTSCARSLSADLLCKISLSGSLHQNPVGPLVQDLCMRIFCPRSLCHDVCIMVLYDLLCKIPGSLAQDLSVMMSASGSCRTSCARSLYVNLLCKISLPRCLHQDPVGLLVQDLCM